MKKKRDYNIDLLRILSCIMIIALHETGLVYNYFFKWTCMQTIIRPFLFIFVGISGYYLLNNKDDFKTFYKKRFTTIVYPLIIYSALILMFKNTISNNYILSGLNLHFIKKLITGQTSEHLWFIYSIIGLYLITPFIKVMLKKINNKENILLLLIIFFFTTINPVLDYFGYSIQIEMPFQSIMLFYYILGYYMHNIKLSKKAFIILSFVEIINILSIIFYFKSAPYVATTLYTSSINMIISFIFIFESFKKIKVNQKFNKIISYVSERTYPIYIIHYFILQQLNSYLQIKYTKNNILYIVPYKVLLIFVISLFITSITYLIKRVLMFNNKKNNIHK